MANLPWCKAVKFIVRQVFTMKCWFLLFVFSWLSLLGCVILHAAEPKSRERPYSLGPLKIEEFKGQVKPDSSDRANTATRISYQFKLAFLQLGQQATVTVKSLTLETIFLPDDSWYGPNAPTGLLDHEQGHFDIAEIHARRAALEWEKDRRAGKLLSATGNTRQAAQQAVMDKLNGLRQMVDAKIAQENAEYDRLTRHGLSSAEQSEIRKIQKLTLARLVEEREDLDPKRKTRTQRKGQVQANSVP